jgi:predicted nucleotide-binding protein
VTVLRDPDVEEPSDIRGLVYVPLDPEGQWKLDLVKDLVESGIPVDVTRMS